MLSKILSESVLAGLGWTGPVCCTEEMIFKGLDREGLGMGPGD